MSVCPHCGSDIDLPICSGEIFGKSEGIMVLAAVRYCLGRQTYIVSDCVHFIYKIWPKLQPDLQALIEKDIKNCFEFDDRDRRDGRAVFHLGSDYDRQQWALCFALWNEPEPPIPGFGSPIKKYEF